ncbi:hypothetical protein GDO86_012292 [Hymenochirus boettgeri]|uniref:Uncharacterized protein n=1 Tax=Hymenochirus boettgeri TaxID=247094 RepID=A0A8T2IQM3_9PIPI|nr:hypothetical protein GDO86_012292 [Hymenochirus boettgeri]
MNFMTESDNGTYQCKAENFMGISTYRFELSVKREPVTPESPANKPGLSGGEIAGIVIGVLAGLVLIGVAVFFIVKANKKKSKDKNKTINLRNPAEKTQDDKADELKYAELNFQGKNSPVASTQHIPETEYSTVKTAKHR